MRGPVRIAGAMLCTAFALLAQVKPAGSVAVPFVGCKSDGQIGPIDAPKKAGRTPSIGGAAARQLAYYSSQGLGVLAPRGWYCFDTYGSGGGALFVSPQPIDTEHFPPDGRGFAGPAIEIDVRSGNTSGRFEVAQVIARVFPAYRAFARRVIEEDILPASEFVFEPYPADRLVYKTKSIVEFTTPASADGLGTRSWLEKNGSPIEGVAILAGETDLIQLSVRLPPDMRGLAPVIIRDVEVAARRRLN